MDVKKMLQDGFKKVQVAIVIQKDRNGREHLIVVDTPDHAKMYKGSDSMQLVTMYVKDTNIL